MHNRRHLTITTAILMNFYLIILFLLVSFSNACYSEQIEMPTSTCLASTEGLINSLVGNHVCAISGDFIDSHVDLNIPGPETLAVRRTYCSSDMYPSIFRGGWKLVEPDCLTAQLSQNGTTATGKTSHGAYVKYARNIARHETNLIHFNLVKLPGITNCHAEMISGRTNIRNNKLSISRDRHIMSANLVDSMGYKKIYKGQKRDDIILEFPLVEERSPRGNLKRFEYGKDEVKIISSNSNKNVQYGFINLVGDKSRVLATSSTDEKVSFKFKSYSFRKNGEKTKRDFLQEVSSTQKPSIKYDYIRNSNDYPILSSITIQNKEILQIEYYQEGKNIVGERIINKTESAKCTDRVKQIKTISGDGTCKSAYQFFYHL